MNIIIIFIILFCVIFIFIRKAIKTCTPIEEEKIFKAFVENMSKEGRVLDENNNPIYNIEVQEKISGSFNNTNLKQDLNKIYSSKNFVIRMVKNKITFEKR